MNISGGGRQVVSLDELVPQPECLKLLILHTPYSLVIDSLPLCLNLVKLDLSKNNLHSFPYIGHFTALRFMFLHDNCLTVAQLRAVFQQNGLKGPLARSIVWVTFYGNPTAFLGRHYLATQTSAIAVDTHMVVPEEQTADLLSLESPPFPQQFSLAHLLDSKAPAKHSSEEAYMQELWRQMAEIRASHTALFPIIRIQKVFRGWRVRRQLGQHLSSRKRRAELTRWVFEGWRQWASRMGRVRRLLRRGCKEYLMWEGREMRGRRVEQRLVELGRGAAARVAQRHSTFRHEYRLYRAVRGNWLRFKSLYHELQLEQHPAIYIHRNGLPRLKQTVLPYLDLLEAGSESRVELLENRQFRVQTLHDFYPPQASEFLKIMLTNFKSVAFTVAKQTNTAPRKRKVDQSGLKSVYRRPPHVSTKRQLELQEMTAHLNLKAQFELNEWVRLQAPPRQLQNIARGIYLNNQGRLGPQTGPATRVQMLSWGMLRRSASATTIQRYWKGYSFRKKHLKSLEQLWRLNRAVVLVQRWARRLPAILRARFMEQSRAKLQTIHDSRFYLSMQHYIDFQNGAFTPSGVRFAEQSSRVYQQTAGDIVITWDGSALSCQLPGYQQRQQCLFGQGFLSAVTGLAEKQAQERFTFEELLRPCPPTFLLHHKTSIRLLSRKGSKWVEVQCASRSEARLRGLALLLLSFRGGQRSEGIVVESSGAFTQAQLHSAVPVDCRQSAFVCTHSEAETMPSCQSELASVPWIVHTKCYVPADEGKPTKLEQKLCIFLPQFGRHHPVKTAPPPPLTEHRRYRTEVDFVYDPSLGAHSLEAPDYLTETVGKERPALGVAQRVVRKMVRKRSMKGLQVNKRIKIRKDQPSFVLDSISIQDKLQTQADAERLLTQVSNCENNSLQPNATLEPAESTAQEARVRVERVSHERKAQRERQKQSDSFSKRFVNLGNFIQNQFASEHQRRVRTEVQSHNQHSATSVRRQAEGSQARRLHQLDRTHERTREAHSAHRQLMAAHSQQAREQVEQHRQEIRHEREKQAREKSKLKRLKVSFAEECYPLALRHKKSSSFV